MTVGSTTMTRVRGICRDNILSHQVPFNILHNKIKILRLLVEEDSYLETSGSPEGSESLGEELSETRGEPCTQQFFFFG